NVRLESSASKEKNSDPPETLGVDTTYDIQVTHSTHEVMQDRPQQGVLNVKAAAQTVLASLLLAGFLLPARSSPQAPTTRSTPVTGTVVAVVDVSAIFEKHAGFKSAMEQMRQDFQGYESELRARHEALSKERDEMLQFGPVPPEYVQ